MRGVFDLEGNGLLDHTTIDYLTAPFTIKPTFRLWCAVIHDIDTGAVYRFAGMEELRNGFLPMFRKLKVIIGHNIIDYDLLVLKLVFGIDYVIGEQCYIDGNPVEIIDTLVWSKCLNPDRYGGHSLDEWGKRLGYEKIDWRSEAMALGLIETHAPKGAEFGQYHPKMLDYNDRDCGVNVKLYWALLEEIGDWPWANPICLEQQVRDIVTRQSHRGFWFDALLAQANVRELDKLMEELRAIVEPTLPPKLMGKTKLKEYQGPAKPFKKDGTPSVHMVNFANKHEGALEQRDDGWYLKAYGNEWKLPLGDTPIKTHEPAAIKDTTHIKGWLVELGWQPSQYKERDLTVNTKKQKLTQEKFEETVERYVEQTLSSPFRDHRCEELGVRPSRLREKLLRWDMKRPLKVYTNPTITVGMEKEIDPQLLKLADLFPHAKLVSEYLTYSHRRNSILGGGYDPDEIDDDDEFAGKGFLAAERISVDGRIPTPADSCGAGTSRFKHRLVANVPRITSLYGDKMRAQFGVDVAEGFVQMGYDFASLEAMIESHYCWKYDTEEGKPYCNSLTQEKPNDVHTKTAKLIETMVAEAIGKAFPFTRGAAKPVKYACAYGAQPARVAKTVGCSVEIGTLIHKAYWEAAKPLALLGEKLKYYWETTGGKKFILGLDGRKIPTRSASALINSLFQSAGVICAKRAMVLHEQKLKAAGLYVDFFKDDWKNAKFVQQLIAYHDEAQLEMHKSLVKWKMFKTEEEAREFKNDNPGWSEIGHSAKGYFIGWCEAGRAIQEAVVETSRYYKLNVTLAADYILGLNWRDCH
jgi:hypothetical protein